MTKNIITIPDYLYEKMAEDMREHIKNSRNKFEFEYWLKDIDFIVFNVSGSVYWRGYNRLEVQAECVATLIVDSEDFYAEIPLVTDFDANKIEAADDEVQDENLAIEETNSHLMYI